MHNTEDTAMLTLQQITFGMPSIKVGVIESKEGWGWEGSTVALDQCKILAEKLIDSARHQYSDIGLRRILALDTNNRHWFIYDQDPISDADVPDTFATPISEITAENIKDGLETLPSDFLRKVMN